MATSLGSLAAYRTAQLGPHAELLDRLKATYLKTGRDEIFDSLLERCLLKLSTRLGEGVREEAIGLLVIGDSGAGKSRTVIRNVGKHSLFPGFMRPESGCPGLGVRCRGVDTLRVLAKGIMRASGYPLGNVKENEAWTQVRDRLEHLGILLLYVDEVTNLLRAANARELTRILDNFKGLLNDPRWPVILVLSGTAECEEYVRRNEELCRRLVVMTLDPLTPADLPVLADHVKDLAGKAGLTLTNEVLGQVVPRLAHAACQQFGSAIDVTIQAIAAALVKNRPDLALLHFEHVYAEATQASPDANPFTAANWSRIVPRPVASTDDDEAWKAVAAIAAASRRKVGLG